MTAGAGSAVARRTPAWWNFTVLGADMAFFSLGLAISSVYTVLPLFVHHLTADNVAVALIPAVRALGLYGPQLAVANFVERRRHALPYILIVTVLERVPYLVLAVCAVWLSSAHAPLLLALFYLLIFLALLGGGLTYPAWLDLIARAIPSSWIGRFMGFWTGVGGMLGIGGAAVATALLFKVRWPLNFALCFALTFVAMVISFVLLALGREPERIVHAPPQARGHSVPSRAETLQALWAVVRHDGGLRRLLASNALVGIATMASALFAVAALHLGGLSGAQVSAEGSVLFLAMTGGNVLWGLVGDHVGHRQILVWSSLCAALAALLALAASGFWAYAVVYLVLGLQLSGVQLAGFTLITQFGPETRRPTYVALASVAYAPFVIGAPLLGGVLADAWGYRPVFVLTAAAGIAALLAFQFWVPDPERAQRVHLLRRNRTPS
ncbi:MAG TPA: MFS transporter [Ktedonobacterales bacterium]|nr:MFS transporter [Ktedonobacterales bacterium]